MLSRLLHSIVIAHNIDSIDESGYHRELSMVWVKVVDATDTLRARAIDALFVSVGLPCLESPEYIRLWVTREA